MEAETDGQASCCNHGPGIQLISPLANYYNLEFRKYKRSCFCPSERVIVSLAFLYIYMVVRAVLA